MKCVLCPTSNECVLSSISRSKERKKRKREGGVEGEEEEGGSRHDSQDSQKTEEGDLGEATWERRTWEADLGGGPGRGVECRPRPSLR
ncbi:hypothetical protein GBAR_LOCUS23000 [Geodia barretti]|uniref:Uncharacterized protein n=1 Tax=Geodia barretti TaxID=519541 RepID=A0AA35T4M1_GEOBA|nr:hypothetical protein GBAR_LOCUS23000 [Geodia barretti]